MICRLYFDVHHTWQRNWQPLASLISLQLGKLKPNNGDHDLEYSARMSTFSLVQIRRVILIYNAGDLCDRLR